jgi:hypothetical protein
MTLANMGANGVRSLAAMNVDAFDDATRGHDLAAATRSGAGAIPQFTGLPRLISAGETRFVMDEVVLQVDCDTPQAMLDRVARVMDLTIVSSVCLTQTRMDLLRLHINSGQTVAQLIRALARYQVVAIAQANFIYTLIQDQQQLAQDPDLADRSQDEGDPAQYSLGKLGLMGLHRQIKGSNVPVARSSILRSIFTIPISRACSRTSTTRSGAPPKCCIRTAPAWGAIAAHRRLMGIAPAARLYAIHACNAGSAESTTFNILKNLDWAADRASV